MSKPANKTLIGVFVLGGIALVVLAVVVLGSGKFFKSTIPGVCYFEGSVGGLNVGAPVVFRGVKIGAVTGVTIHYNAAKALFLIPVYIELETTKPLRETTKEQRQKEFQLLVEKGLRARLEMQSFVTGQYQITLDLYPDKPAVFVGAEPGYLEFPTVPTPIQEISRKIEELPLVSIINKVDATMDGLSRVVNSPEVVTALKSIAEAAMETRQLVKEIRADTAPALTGVKETLKDAQKLTREIQELAQNANAQIQPLSSGAQETLAEAKQMLRQLDARTTAISGHLETMTKNVSTLVQNIDAQIEPLSSSLRSTLASIENTSGQAGATLQAAQQTLGFVNGSGGDESELIFGLSQMLKEVKVAARAIRDLADTLEQQPQSPLYGKKPILRRSP